MRAKHASGPRRLGKEVDLGLRGHRRIIYIDIDTDVAIAGMVGDTAFRAVYLTNFALIL